MRKYEFTGEVKIVFGKSLRQIKASFSFGNVTEGDIGGWIEKEENLNPDPQVSGDAWVYGDARVYGNAQVYGDAQVSGNAQVSGDAWVSGDARVYGNAWVYGDARVYGNAQVYGDARVYGDAQVSGDAWVYGDARVYGNAQVYGDAQVSGDARVYGNAWVYGDARVLSECSKTPICIFGLTWGVTIADTTISIGCQFHSIAEWRGFDDGQISNMSGGALEFWKKTKDVIFSLIDNRGE